MAEPAKQIEKKIMDEGLEVGAQNLTEERIAEVINRVLKGESGARLQSLCRYLYPLRSVL